MAAPSLDDNVRNQANRLADDNDVTLSPDQHTASGYAALLAKLINEKPGEELKTEFMFLARFVCQTYETRNPQVLKRIGSNAMLICRIREFTAGEAEDQVGLHQGTLAKTKHGQQLELAPVKLINLAALLQVPLSLLVANYENNPDGLRQAVEALPLEAEEDDEVDVVETLSAELQQAPSPLEEEICNEVQPLETAIPVQQTKEKEEPMSLQPISEGSQSLSSLDETLLKVRAPAVAANVRAVAKKGGVTLTELLSTIGITNRRHLENIEKGDGAFTATQLVAMAQRLNVDVMLLCTGEGLKVPQKRAQSETALVHIGAKKLLLPPISDEQRQDFYRSRCLSAGVEVADGKDYRMLLAAAGSKEPVDWEDLWRTHTKQGVAHQALCDQIFTKTKSWGDIAKHDFMLKLHQVMWPDGGV